MTGSDDRFNNGLDDFFANLDPLVEMLIVMDNNIHNDINADNDGSEDNSNYDQDRGIL